MQNSKTPNSPKQDAHSDPDQARRFRKAARDLGCDGDEEQFQGTLRKVAKHRPLESTTKKNKGNR